jgi:hypothetical protein
MFVWRGISRTWLSPRWKSLGNRIFPSPQQQTRAWTTSINPNNADVVFADGSWIDVWADYIAWRLSKATAAHLADCGPPNQARSPRGIELNASMTSNTPLNRPHGTDTLAIRSHPSLCCRTSVRVIEGCRWRGVLSDVMTCLRPDHHPRTTGSNPSGHEYMIISILCPGRIFSTSCCIPYWHEDGERKHKPKWG